ncbi:MAG: TonB-dependent receptor [Ignavibacteriales bacterium]|nr:TonB-dependent receptor [Ignavibacteriales bacterium]
MKIWHSFLLLIFFAVNTAAQQYSIKGRVIDGKDTEPLLGVNIILEEFKTGVASNNNGEFEFKNIPAGNYKLRFSYIGHKTVIQTVVVPQPDLLIIQLNEGTVDLQEVVITGNPFGTDPKQISQSTLSLANLDLQIRNSSTVAEMLNYQPGVSMRSNGTAVSRPVIRGFSNSRILILENGLRMGDLSNTSDDHGVSSDGSSAERIEVLRGPASLLYGSNAIGGVINIITESIPNFIPNEADGTIQVSSSSVNKMLNGSADVHFGINRFAFHGNYFNRTNDDYKDGAGNTVSNSDLSSSGFQFGMSFIPDFGTAGLSFSSYNNNYGIPIQETDTSEEEEVPIKIELEKREARILLESSKLDTFVKSFSLKAGYQDYKHKEIAKTTGETGTSFGLKSFSADLSFKHDLIADNLQGAFGLWALNQQYTVSGEEAFTPNADYLSIAAYLLEQWQLDKLNFQFGVRYEMNKINIPSAVISDLLFPEEEKTFNSFSGSIGIVYSLTNDVSIFTNIANAFRAPTIEELSSYAIHEATGTFDIGKRSLGNENNYGIDFGLRMRKPHHVVEISGYYNIINNYIFREPLNLFYNPELADHPFNDTSGIPVYQYTQADAKIFGAELKAQYEFTNSISVTTITDYVVGKKQNDNENLPQLPPFRFSIEPRYTNDNYWFGFIWKLAAEQNKTASFETTTKGYGVVDIYGGIKILTGDFVHMLNVRIDNLLDQPYKEHLSVIKNFAYMPGRNFQLSYKFLF